MKTRKSDSHTYKEAKTLSSDHYENFPVASFLFRKELRKDVALIYKFARTADDIADEGNYSNEERRISLTRYRNEFENALENNYHNTFWKLLHDTIQKRKLNPQHFSDLLSAFEQDIFKNEYATFDDLLGYCKNSANPVGRIILELYGIDDEKTVSHSDKICTALQLTNFWQDVSIDLQKNRIYIPQEDFAKFGTEKSILKSEQIDEKLRQIIKFEIERTERMFYEGSEILNFLTGRLKWQIKWTINGGMKILNKIRKNNYDVLNYRPTLSKIDYITTLFQRLNSNAD